MSTRYPRAGPPETPRAAQHHLDGPIDSTPTATTTTEATLSVQTGIDSGYPPLGGLLDLPASRTYALPPCGRRHLWTAVVMTCAECSGGHVFRSGMVALLLAGRLVRRCPVTGAKVLLGPVQRRREARRRHLDEAAA